MVSASFCYLFSSRLCGHDETEATRYGYGYRYHPVEARGRGIDCNSLLDPRSLIPSPNRHTIIEMVTKIYQYLIEVRGICSRGSAPPAAS